MIPPNPNALTLPNALAALRADPDREFVVLFRHGSLIVEIYRPVGMDRQQPHDRDEVYVIASGTGWFVNGSERHGFEPGQVLFVAAGVEHRFEDFSNDFATWVMFYGPEGGEHADHPTIGGESAS